jgi:hypothetical protein
MFSSLQVAVGEAAKPQVVEVLVVIVLLISLE